MAIAMALQGGIGAPSPLPPLTRAVLPLSLISARFSPPAAPARPPAPGFIHYNNTIEQQAALVRDSMDHPLVAHARAVFDAAIRKVEPSRGPRPAAPVAVAAPAVGGGGPAATAEDEKEDELDHAHDDGGDVPPFDGGMDA